MGDRYLPDDRTRKVIEMRAVHIRDGRTHRDQPIEEPVNAADIIARLLEDED